MNRMKWSAGALASTILLFAGLSVGAAHAAPVDTLPPDTTPTLPVDTTPAPPAPSVPAPTPAQFSLPFMGAALTVTVTTGPGGNLADVAITPADGMVATKVSPRAVVFTNADGSVKVSVKSKHGTQSVSAKAGSLAALQGPGSWTGDIFAVGAPVTVLYTVGTTADGGPDLTVNDPGDPSAVVGEVQHRSEGAEAAARVSITFTSADGQSRSLTISVKVEPSENESDDDSSSTSIDPAAPPSVEASLRITLSRVRGVPVAADVAAGPKTWTGLLCDATPASIAYTLNADGTITDVVATPTASVQADSNNTKVDMRWGDHERVRIRTRLDDGQITVNVEDRIRCKDATDPTVNVPTSLDASNGDDEGDDQDEEESDDHNGDSQREEEQHGGGNQGGGNHGGGQGGKHGGGQGGGHGDDGQDD